MRRLSLVWRSCTAEDAKDGVYFRVKSDPSVNEAIHGQTGVFTGCAGKDGNVPIKFVNGEKFVVPFNFLEVQEQVRMATDTEDDVVAVRGFGNPKFNGLYKWSGYIYKQKRLYTSPQGSQIQWNRDKQSWIINTDKQSQNIVSTGDVEHPALAKWPNGVVVQKEVAESIQVGSLVEARHYVKHSWGDFTKGERALILSIDADGDAETNRQCDEDGGKKVISKADFAKFKVVSQASNDWVEYDDENTRRKYYYSKSRDQTQWTKPEDFVQIARSSSVGQSQGKHESVRPSGPAVVDSARIEITDGDLRTIRKLITKFEREEPHLRHVARALRDRFFAHEKAELLIGTSRQHMICG